MLEHDQIRGPLRHERFPGVGASGGLHEGEKVVVAIEVQAGVEEYRLAEVADQIASGLHRVHDGAVEVVLLQERYLFDREVPLDTLLDGLVGAAHEVAAGADGGNDQEGRKGMKATFGLHLVGEGKSVEIRVAEELGNDRDQQNADHDGHAGCPPAEDQQGHQNQSVLHVRPLV